MGTTFILDRSAQGQVQVIKDLAYIKGPAAHHGVRKCANKSLNSKLSVITEGTKPMGQEIYKEKELIPTAGRTGACGKL